MQLHERRGEPSILQLRNFAHEVSQEEAAKQLGVSRRTVQSARGFLHHHLFSNTRSSSRRMASGRDGFGLG
jgi:hypothetical protein